VGVVESEATDVFRSLPGVHADMKIMGDTFDDLGFLLPTILVPGEWKAKLISSPRCLVRVLAMKRSVVACGDCSVFTSATTSALDKG
jgi:hypothetical protein